MLWFYTSNFLIFKRWRYFCRDITLARLESCQKKDKKIFHSRVFWDILIELLFELDILETINIDISTRIWLVSSLLYWFSDTNFFLG
jgi:hypothetical protein